MIYVTLDLSKCQVLNQLTILFDILNLFENN